MQEALAIIEYFMIYKLMPILFSFSAMNRVAALSSDKEQLEHLCARLQVRVLTET